MDGTPSAIDTGVETGVRKSNRVEVITEQRADFGVSRRVVSVIVVMLVAKDYLIIIFINSYPQNITVFLVLHQASVRKNKTVK